MTIEWGDDETPVIFGHYLFTGVPQWIDEWACCVDYSAGGGGPSSPTAETRTTAASTPDNSCGSHRSRRAPARRAHRQTPTEIAPGSTVSAHPPPPFVPSEH